MGPRETPPVTSTGTQRRARNRVKTLPLCEAVESTIDPGRDLFERGGMKVLMAHNARGVARRRSVRSAVGENVGLLVALP